MADGRPTRRIRLCADDYGIAPGVNAAIRDLVARGRLNATSVMVRPASFTKAEADALSALNADGQRVAIGLHVTLTAPFMPLWAPYRPLKAGRFHSVGTTLQLALLRRLDVAARRAPGAWVRQCGSAAPLMRRLADPKGLLIDWLSRTFRARAKAAGVATNPAFAGTYAFTAEADIAALFPGFLEGLPDGGLIMCHPGFVDEELTRLDPLTHLREREYAYLAGDAFPGALAAYGVALA